MSKEIDVELQFCQRFSSREDDCVVLSIKDENSRIGFLEIKLTHEQFGKLIAGNGRSMDVKATVRGLDRVGMTLVRENRSVVLPDKLHYDSSKAEIWIEENCKEDGWNISPALRSQGSISHDNGVHTAHYTVYKYVE